MDLALCYAWCGDMLTESVPLKLGMSKDNFHAILDKLNVDLLHGYAFTGPAGFNLLPAKPLGVGNNRHHCYELVPDLFTVAWTYELPTTKTQALCSAQEDILVALQDILDHQKALFRHPMTLVGTPQRSRAMKDLYIGINKKGDEDLGMPVANVKDV